MKNPEQPSFAELLEKAKQFEPVLKKQKEALAKADFWYPYGTLNNFQHLLPFDQCAFRMPAAPGTRIADVGAADGDLSFFLSSLGYDATIIDFGPTNFNGLRGAKLLADAHYPSVAVTECDLDSQFKRETNQVYDVIFFLGILYHLKNPFYILETFSKMSRFMFLSTRVAKFFDITSGDRAILRNHIDVSNFSVSYLLGPTESNNDATNYWIFSITGLQRILDRSGWNILKLYTVGDTSASNQRDNNHDERAFCLLESKVIS